MSGLEWTIKIAMPRRRAAANITSAVANRYALGSVGGDYECCVLACLQETFGGDNTPIFVCEFKDGRVVNLPTEWVRFLDTKEEWEVE